MRRHAFAAVSFLFFAWTAAAQVRITGVVTERDGSAEPSPVAGAYVLAKAGSPERAVAEAETDSQGRYALAGLPQGRLTLSVQAQGYYTVRAGNLEADSIARSCTGAGDCGETDFEIARAAVIEGWLTDSYGDPFQDIQIELMPESVAGADPMQRMRRASRATSDDRGYFRIWGVKPGSYELALKQSRFAFRGGPPVELEKRTIEIAPGQTEHQARIALKTDANVFSIRGEVVGVAAEDLERTGISIQPIGGDEPGSWTRYESLREGTFAFGGLRKGEYVLRLAHFAEDTRKWSYLDKLTVDRDIAGLELAPQPPTGVRGRVAFVDSPPSNVYFTFAAPGKTGLSREVVEARGPEYELEHAGLPPGEYEIGMRAQDYYLVERKRVTVSLGRMEEIELRVSNQRATVRGAARLAEGNARQAAAHFTVGLRGERGRHKARADDSGGFVFEKVIPGEYEIAAWESLDVDIEDEEAWRRAGENRKRLVLEAGFETEIDLTVTR